MRVRLSCWAQGGAIQRCRQRVGLEGLASTYVLCPSTSPVSRFQRVDRIELRGWMMWAHLVIFELKNYLQKTVDFTTELLP